MKTINYNGIDLPITDELKGAQEVYEFFYNLTE